MSILVLAVVGQEQFVQ